MPKNKDDKKFSLKELNQKHLQAWEGVLTRVLSYRSRTYEVKKSEDLKSFHNKCAAFEKFDFKYGYLSKEDALVGRFTKSSDDIAKVADLLHEIYSSIEDPHLCELSVAEVLTKVLAYRNLEHGTEINIPTNIQGTIKMRKFRVDKVFDLWHQMKAFGLTDVDGKESPVLLFRGTDFTLTSEASRSSVVSNLDPSGPGRTIYLKARESIRAWLGLVTDTDRKARAYGYSLGGAFASYAVVMDHEFFSKNVTRSSFAFNHPGVESDLQAQWEELPEKSKPMFAGFVSKGDPVSKYGKLLGKTTQLSINKRLAPIQSHVTLFFSQPQFHMAEVDLEEENRARSRHIYTKLHAKSAKLFYDVALKNFFPFMVPDEGSDDPILWT